MIIVKKGTEISNIDFQAGAVILIDKPLEWTSFDVVNKLRYSLRRKYGLKKFKVGHNGTLDPLATGLLMIFTGKYTKLIAHEENHSKRYRGTVKLGATTTTLDREMEEIDIQDPSAITLEQLKAAMSTFHGEMMQEVPIFSANKVNGVPMYKLARQNKEFKPKVKPVIYHEVNLLKYDNPYVEVDISCGKGTYIRAFARDLGKGLNTSAYLYALERTAIADYKVEDALDVHDVFNQINPDS